MSEASDKPVKQRDPVDQRDVIQATYDPKSVKFSIDGVETTGMKELSRGFIDPVWGRREALAVAFENEATRAGISLVDGAIFVLPDANGLDLLVCVSTPNLTTHLGGSIFKGEATEPEPRETVEALCAWFVERLHLDPTKVWEPKR